MEKALYLNGIFEEVLEEIITSQKKKNSVKKYYLQPYSSSEIKVLKEYNPSESNPIKLLISTTKNLNNICYKANIIGWENKYEISENRSIELNKHIKKFQPKEENVYLDDKKIKYKNLITILNLEKLNEVFSITNLIKIKDGRPLGLRTRAGGWSVVRYPPEWVFSQQFIIADDFNDLIETDVKKSINSNHEERLARIENANKLPETIKIISKGFYRNPDIIVEVLFRANGICENCNKFAPFIRAKDNSPYLEIHHKVPLSEGGEDSIENAIAVCPNCHRKFHFG